MYEFNRCSDACERHPRCQLATDDRPVRHIATSAFISHRTTQELVPDIDVPRAEDTPPRPPSTPAAMEPEAKGSESPRGSEASSGDCSCAICLERADLEELAILKGCDHTYCGAHLITRCCRLNVHSATAYSAMISLRASHHSRVIREECWLYTTVHTVANHLRAGCRARPVCSKHKPFLKRQLNLSST